MSKGCCAEPASKSGCCPSEKKQESKAGGGCCPSEKKQESKAGGGCCSSDKKQESKGGGGGCCSQVAPSSAPLVLDEEAGSGETVYFNVEGMTCAGCQLRVERHLNALPGVRRAAVSLLTHKAEVDGGPSPEVLEAEINSLGFKATRMSGGLASTVVLRLGCRNDRGVSMLASLPGVKRVTPRGAEEAEGVDIEVEYAPEDTGARTLRDAIVRQGTVCDLSPLNGSGEANTTSARELAEISSYFYKSMALAAPIFLIRYVLEGMTGPAAALDSDVVPGVTLDSVLCLLFATPVQLVIAAPIYSSAWSAVTKSGRLNMDVLISLSTSIAYGYSLLSVIQSAVAGEVVGDTMFEVSAMLVFLILGGRLMEKRAKQHTTSVISHMMSLQADHALLVDEDADEDELIDTALVQRGDLLRVMPGARVPADGVIVEGNTVVDESMLSGESAHVAKRPGDFVIGSSVNHHGCVTVRVQHTIQESVLAHILQMVEQAQAAKPEAQRVADIVAGRFTMFIVATATIVFFAWWRLAATGQVEITTPGQTPLVFALRFAIAVLVISCPCAISLAVPTAVMVASGVGARRGVLVKGGPVLEKLAQVNVVAFDKTGTLTSGVPAVVDVIPFAGQRVLTVPTPDTKQRLERMWRALGGAERGSEHPVGRALVAEARRVLGGEPPAPSGYEAVPGRGCVATVENARVAAGTLLLLEDEDVEMSDAQMDAVARLETGGRTVVVVARNGVALGAVSLSDSVRPESRAVVRQLQSMGIQVWMLSGDVRPVAEEVAASVGIWPNRVKAPVLPDRKLREVSELQSGGHTVMVVGDGMNDAPALAQADVGVAMGQGTDLACDTADVVLIKSDLRDVLMVLALGRATMRRIKLNFAWGMAYNLIMMPLAAGAYYSVFRAAVPPAFAGLSELLSSVPVILFSLLLNGFEAPPLTAAAAPAPVPTPSSSSAATERSSLLGATSSV